MEWAFQLNIILKENVLIYVQVERVYLLSNIVFFYYLLCLYNIVQRWKTTSKNALQLEFIYFQIKMYI